MRRRDFRLKYFFTQLSAPVVGIGVVFLLLALVGKLGVLESTNRKELEILIISIIFLTVPVTMVIWGKILFFLGILSKDEAKGYPWSKPWKNNKSTII